MPSSRHVFFVDTIFLYDGEVSGDGVGKRVADWWYQSWGLDAAAPRKDVVGAVMDNVEYMTKCSYREHFHGPFPNSIHVCCISHIYNIIGKVFWEHPNMKPLRTLVQAARSLFKVKRNVARRQRLRKFFVTHGKPGSSPPNFCATRWNGTWTWVCWMLEHRHVFKDFVTEVIAKDEPVAAQGFVDSTRDSRTLWLPMHFYKEYSGCVFHQI